MRPIRITLRDVERMLIHQIVRLREMALKD